MSNLTGRDTIIYATRWTAGDTSPSQDQIDFGKELVGNWLKEYMFKGEDEKLPTKIAAFLSKHKNFKTHGKHISIVKAKEIGLKIEQLENNQDFQDKVLSAFHSTMHTSGSTNTAKVIANQNGNCFLKQFNSDPQRIVAQPKKIR